MPLYHNYIFTHFLCTLKRHKRLKGLILTGILSFLLLPKNLSKHHGQKPSNRHCLTLHFLYAKHYIPISVKTKQELTPVFNTVCTNFTITQDVLENHLGNILMLKQKIKSLSVTKSVCRLAKDSPLKCVQIQIKNLDRTQYVNCHGHKIFKY